MRKRVKKTMPLKLKDYLQKVQWDDVAVELVGIYPSARKDLGKYQTVFELLTDMAPVATDTQIVVGFSGWVSAYFRQSYLVYGRKDPEDKGDTLAFTPWAEWLGREVVLDPPRGLSDGRIVAVCLHCMTGWGFTEDEIKEELTLIEQHLEDSLTRQDSAAEDADEKEPDWEDYFPDDTMREKLRRLRKWLRWGSLSREYFGENGTWFVNRFIGAGAPEYYDEIDRQTIKAALKEIAQDLVWVAKEL